MPDFDFDNRLAGALDSIEGPVERAEAKKRVEEAAAKLWNPDPIRHYVLDGFTFDHPVPATLPEWVEWMKLGAPGREVDRWSARGPSGEVVICTSFLGVSHGLDSVGNPVLWETMIFVDGDSRYHERCSGSRRHAKSMHSAVVSDWLSGRIETYKS